MSLKVLENGSIGNPVILLQNAKYYCGDAAGMPGESNFSDAVLLVSYVGNDVVRSELI